MGKIKQGILGGFSGKVGGVVGGSWKGIATMKSLPQSVANPRSPGQVAQRNKMSGVVKASKFLMAALISIYWNPFAQRMSGYNKFVKENIANFTGGVLTNFANFFSMRGSLTGAVVSSVIADASDNLITVNYLDNSGIGDAVSTDKIIVTVYNQSQEYWKTSDGTQTRDGASIEIIDNDMLAGEQIHVYTGAARADISKVADSVYNTVAVVA